MCGSFMFLFYLILFLFNCIFAYQNNSNITTNFSEPIYDHRGKEQSSDYLLCRTCGGDIAPLKAVINIPSPVATVKHNISAFGLENVLIQKLSLGDVDRTVDIVTLSKSFCFGTDKFSEGKNWFPGFVQRPCLCSRCYKSLGWVFDFVTLANDEVPFPSSYGFYAIIYEQIISEFYADGLVSVGGFELS